MPPVWHSPVTNVVQRYSKYVEVLDDDSENHTDPEKKPFGRLDDERFLQIEMLAPPNIDLEWQPDEPTPNFILDVPFAGSIPR